MIVIDKNRLNEIFGPDAEEIRMILADYAETTQRVYLDLLYSMRTVVIRELYPDRVNKGKVKDDSFHSDDMRFVALSKLEWKRIFERIDSQHANINWKQRYVTVLRNLLKCHVSHDGVYENNAVKVLQYLPGEGYSPIKFKAIGKTRIPKRITSEMLLPLLDDLRNNNPDLYFAYSGLFFTSCRDGAWMQVTKDSFESDFIIGSKTKVTTANPQGNATLYIVEPFLWELQAWFRDHERVYSQTAVSFRRDFKLVFGKDYWPGNARSSTLTEWCEQGMPDSVQEVFMGHVLKGVTAKHYNLLWKDQEAMTTIFHAFFPWKGAFPNYDWSPWIKKAEKIKLFQQIRMTFG